MATGILAPDAAAVACLLKTTGIHNRRRIELSHLFRSRALPAAACLAIGALAGAPATNAASAISQSPSATNATVSCTQLDPGHVRCVMTVKGGSGLSGTVTMRITRGKLVVALGHGRVTRGEATLTMRVLHRMTPGQYVVAMVVTLNSTQVLRIPTTSSPGAKGHTA
jgi:hypothetical protein